jgi:phosphoribosylamine--glycine ligase
MRVLVVGSGGREHALAWRLACCPSVEAVVAAPGNPGIALEAECHAVAAEDVAGLTDLARRERIDLVVVGPEFPLTRGLADRVREAGIPCFGPGSDGAMLEGSKAWSKDLMRQAGIPTASYRVFHEAEPALAWLDQGEGPIVVKASGLAAGKGVIVCADRAAARIAVRMIMEERHFGAAGDRVVIEEFLTGEEASILTLTDGERLLPLVSSQDHKRIGDGDTGSNTGGMGAYAPAPVVTPSVLEKVRTRIMEPLLAELRRRGIDYRGVIYAGLMIDQAGDPRVIEFNCRFGDPESQVVLPLVEGDLAEALLAAARGELDPKALSMRRGAAVCVVMASGGYPGAYRKGIPIAGLEEAARLEGIVVFHAGTTMDQDRVVTAGGRVLGVTACADDVADAVERAYQAVGRIGFEEAYWRRDIAHRALARRVHPRNDANS